MMQSNSIKHNLLQEMKAPDVQASKADAKTNGKRISVPDQTAVCCWL